ncbi:MAG: DMT family transporter [Pseudomonadota bacterium]
MGLALLSCAFFAATNLIAKTIAIVGEDAPLHPLQLAFGRYLFGTAMLLPILLWRGPQALRSKVPAVYLIRCSCSIGALVCIFTAVAALPLADVTALNYASPFFTLVLARLVLGEHVGHRRWIAVAIGFTGVLFIANPSGGALQPMAVVALLSAVFMAGELISLRFIVLRDSTSTTVLLTNCIAGLICACLAPFVWQSASAAQWGLMALIAVVTVTGQIFFIRAIGMVEASFIAPMFYSTLVYAALFGFIAFGEIPTFATIIGTVLIAACGIYLSRSANAEARSTSSE